MNIIFGDIFDIAKDFDCACITTNGIVKNNGELVMGAGVAKSCKIKYPEVPKILGNLVSQYGNKVHCAGTMQDGVTIVSFPTKYDYRSNSFLDLIRTSAFQLVDLATKNNWTRVLLPRPGIKNGRLDWEEVKDILMPILDDRFYVISNNPKDANVQIGKPISNTNSNKRVLECSSKGDKRYSALYAKVNFLGKTDTIENHYQFCKRINDFIPKQISDIKGKRPTHIIINNVKLDIKYLTDFYKLLWVEYLDNNIPLVTYAKRFDDFNDMFKGKSINCQADVIRQYVKKGRESILNEIKDFVELIKYKETKEELYRLENDFNFKVEDIVNEVSLCVTGHRPKGLFGYNSSPRYKELQNKIYVCLMYFYNQFNVRKVRSGGAQGVDQLFASVAQYISSVKKDFTNEIDIPFKGQELIWPQVGKFSQSEYRYLLQNADVVNVVNKNIDVNTAPKKEISIALYERNNYMVANSDYVLGVYSGSMNDIFSNDNNNSGTLQALQLAYRLNKKIVIINPFDLSVYRINF